MIHEKIMNLRSKTMSIIRTKDAVLIAFAVIVGIICLQIDMVLINLLGLGVAFFIIYYLYKRFKTAKK